MVNKQTSTIERHIKAANYLRRDFNDNSIGSGVLLEVVEGSTADYMKKPLLDEFVDILNFWMELEVISAVKSTKICVSMILETSIQL